MPSTNLEGAKLAIRKRKREILVEILVATIALAAEKFGSGEAVAQRGSVRRV